MAKAIVRRASSLSALFSVKRIYPLAPPNGRLEPGRDIERRYGMGLPHLAALLMIGLASEAALHGALTPSPEPQLGSRPNSEIPNHIPGR